MSKPKPNNQQLFVEWLKKRDPYMYAVVTKVAALKKSEVSGMGFLNWGGVLTSVINTVKDVAPKVVEYSQTKKLLDVQVKRAQQNLPPLDLPQYQASVPNFNPADPYAANMVAQQYVQNPGAFGNKNTLIIGGAVLASLFVFMNSRKRRR